MKLSVSTRRAAAGLALAVAASAAGLLTATEASAASGCYIRASSANVRASPSASATINGVAYKGYTCTELGSDYAGGWTWYRVRISRTGVTGWVRSDLVHTAADDVHTCIPERC